MFAPRLLCHISIHALRVEGDSPRPPSFVTVPDFYPRPPGGGRPHYLYCAAHQRYFYPRPPGGGRQVKELLLHLWCRISIHALRVEGDLRPFPAGTS